MWILKIFKNYFADHLWIAAFDNMLLKSKKLDQVTIEMFISEPKNEES